jgi:hypothetical protein
MKHAWRDHVETLLGTIVFATVCVLEWRRPVTATVFMAALCTLGSATVLQLSRWLWRRLRG